MLCLVWLVGVGIARGETEEWTYTVGAGETLWSISTKYLKERGNWRKLQTRNKITDPKRLPPGTQLRIPLAWLSLQPFQAKILSVHGQASLVTDATSEPVVLSAGMTLKTGDTARTGPDSSMILEFADGSRLLLHANSRLRLDTLNSYPKDTGMVDTRMELREGGVETQVRPSTGPGTRFEIRTPAASTAVRGTDYRVRIAVDSEKSQVEVLSGKIGVTAAGQTQTVAQGFGTVVVPGQPPLPPRRLLPAPLLSMPLADFERTPVSFAWEAIAGAIAYRIQIVLAEPVETVVLSDVVSVSRYATSALEDGDYLIRIRGIDDLALEGQTAEQRFRLVVRPEPPVLRAPQDRAVVQENPPVFAWSESKHASSYHFQLADQPDFESLIIDLPGHESIEYVPKLRLAPGHYYWRVAGQKSAAVVGPFGDTRALTIHSVPLAPKLEQPDVGLFYVVFRWSSNKNKARYRFQVAQDRHFSELAIDTLVSEPSIKIFHPQPGRVYLRVKAIDEEGFESLWSTVQPVDLPSRGGWFLLIAVLLVIVLSTWMLIRKRTPLQ